jgi:hypothetical protein
LPGTIRKTPLARGSWGPGTNRKTPPARGIIGFEAQMATRVLFLLNRTRSETVLGYVVCQDGVMSSGQRMFGFQCSSIWPVVFCKYREQHINICYSSSKYDIEYFNISDCCCNRLWPEELAASYLCTFIAHFGCRPLVRTTNCQRKGWC